MGHSLHRSWGDEENQCESGIISQRLSRASISLALFIKDGASALTIK
jgi:hypothetical protein